MQSKLNYLFCGKTIPLVKETFHIFMQPKLMGTEMENDRNVKKQHGIVFSCYALGIKLCNSMCYPRVCVWDTSEFLMSQRTDWVTV